MRFDAIVRNGTVVTATDTYASDIGIANGKITAIARALPVENAAKALDAAGRLVMPGGIDVHTHLDMPFGGTTSADDFESGTIAAAFGGTTTLIDFAIQAERNEGLSPQQAIYQAAVLRFRPITMTTMAALLGGLPLALGHGQGAEMRRPLGMAIVGGLLFSQALTLYTTPVVYLYMDRARLRWEAFRGRARHVAPEVSPVA